MIIKSFFIDVVLGVNVTNRTRPVFTRIFRAGGIRYAR